MSNLVITHGRCMDGYVAGRVAEKALVGGADVFQAEYGLGPPWHLITSVVSVWIVDFSYDRETMIEIHEKAQSLLVLDHHKSAQAALEGLPFCEFDMERSGAGMAWDHFHPGKPRPWLVDYVEDRDLWRFALPKSREVNMVVNATPFTPEAFDALDAASLHQTMRDGAAILRYMDTFVIDTVLNARLVAFYGHVIPFCSCTRRGLSEVGNALAKDHPFAVCWYQQSDGRYLYSLRSCDLVDVSEIAKMHGGGGHKNAAGFVSDLTPDEMVRA